MIRTQKGRWYLKIEESVHGPFPNKLIGRYLILGRITQQTLISQDKTHWVALENYPALVPEVVKEAGTPQGDRALMLARIREDERSSQTESDETLDERREDEEQVMRLHRQMRDDVLNRYKNQPRKRMAYLFIILLSILFALGIYINSTRQDSLRLADCSANAQAGINWSGCNKQGESLRHRNLQRVNFRAAKLQGADLSASQLQGADLAYSNLSGAILISAQLQGANLKGANLRQANLQGADLSQADLSYAELEGSLLQDARLDQAILDHAIWVNGENCLPGSIGACLIKRK